MGEYATCGRTLARPCQNDLRWVKLPIMSGTHQAAGGRQTYRDAVASEVRAATARAKMSQKSLSEATGIRPSTLSRLWHGRYAFDVEQLDLIAQATGTRLTDLVSPPGYEATTRQYAPSNRPALAA